MPTSKANLPIDYVTKDYDGFLEMMKEQIPVLTPEWTDTSDTDQGMVILQLLAYSLHILGYYQDRAVNENILHLARTKKAVLLLSRFLGYEPATQSPSVAKVTFTKYEGEINKRVIVPIGTKVSTNPEKGAPIIYETTEPLFIEPGVESAVVEVEQGESVNSEVIGRGNGQANQNFQISQPDVIDKSLIIFSKENNHDYYWTKVDTLFDSIPDDRHYMTTRNEENQTTLIFGDGVTGMRLPNDATLHASFRYGGGKIGDVASGLIDTLQDTTITTIESVINMEKATGGRDYESLETARAVAPKQYRTGGKIVTPYDLEDIAVTFPDIVKAKAVETFNETNDVHAYLATESGEPMTSLQKETIRQELNALMIMNQNLYVYDTPYHEYELVVTAYIQDNFLASDVKMELTGTLKDYLNHQNFQLGEPVYLSKIIEQSFFARGVRNVVVNSPASDIIPPEQALPYLKKLTVNIVGGVVV